MKKLITVLMVISLTLLHKMAPVPTKHPEENRKEYFPVTLVALCKVLSTLFMGEEIIITRLSNKNLHFEIKGEKHKGCLIYNLVEEAVVFMTDDWKDDLNIAKIYIVEFQSRASLPI